jgi:hypothetical protein
MFTAKTTVPRTSVLEFVYHLVAKSKKKKATIPQPGGDSSIKDQVIDQEI